MSEDPLGFAEGDENVRRYVGNASTVSADPMGLLEPPLQLQDVTTFMEKMNTNNLAPTQSGDWLDWFASYCQQDTYITPVMGYQINAIAQSISATADYALEFGDAWWDAYLDAVNPWDGVSSETDLLDSMLVGGTKRTRSTDLYNSCSQCIRTRKSSFQLASKQC